MSWHIEGTYFENCNCDMICPCTASGMTAPADNDRCTVAFAFHVDTGDVEGVDVSGLTVCLLADTPAVMSEPGWRVGMLMDASASAEQAEALGAVFGGQRGGPLAGLGPLISEMAGMEQMEMTYSNNGRRHQVRAGTAVDMAVEDFVSPMDPSQQGVKVSGVGFPADLLAAGTGASSRIDVFGMTWDNAGKNSFSAPFAWSA